MLRGTRNARPLAWQHCFRCENRVGPRLHLDETDITARRSRDQVDLTQSPAEPATEDAIKFAHQEQRRDGLAAPAEAFGPLA